MRPIAEDIARRHPLRAALLAAALALTVLVVAGGGAHAQTATVSTMAQLRTAIGNSSITTIQINPGTYLLTSSGSGQLTVERNLTITNTGGGRVVIDGNNASRVFYVNGTTLTLTGITVTRGNGNSGSEGGGIYANSATLRLIRSTISGNATSGGKQGGGIYGNSTTLEITNSTLSGNTAGGSGALGGGIYVNGGSTLLSNSTVASNTAPSSGGGGIYRNGALTLGNSIIADNSGGQVAGSGTITLSGTNLVQGGCTGCGASLTADPKLGALADNGGDSYTHALLAESPALNTAANAQAQATDQRDVARPQGATADIGAYESGTDIAIAKSVNEAAPSEGSTIEFTVTASGAGPDAGSGITVSDVLPPGLTFQSASASQGSYDGATGSWTLGVLASGATATLTLTATVEMGTAGTTITNTASLVAVDQAESSAANDAASASVTVQIQLSVSVTPDGAQQLMRLPSNGTTYAASYAVTNTSAATIDVDLLGSAGAAGAIGIVSVNGTAGDSARVTAIAPGATDTVLVEYTVATLAEGTADTLTLRARIVASPGVVDAGNLDMVIVRPNIQVVRAVASVGAPLPGDELTYTTTVTNVGSEEAMGIALVDSVSAMLQFKVGSQSATLPAGVTAAVSYSSDDGASWSYVPVSGGCSAPAGFDACVNRIRWALSGSLGVTAPANTADLAFVVRVP